MPKAKMASSGEDAAASLHQSNGVKKSISNEDKKKFASALNEIVLGDRNPETLLTILGPARQADAAALAQDELKRQMEQPDGIQDLGLDAGPMWTLEEEKLFEYGLYLYDGSTTDRFGEISKLMCNTRSRDECRRRYMKLVLDVSQIDAGSTAVTTLYFSPYPMQAQVPSHGWM